jgi:hypothetical protein
MSLGGLKLSAEPSRSMGSDAREEVNSRRALPRAGYQTNV